jgi:hypothetical protein
MRIVLGLILLFVSMLIGFAISYRYTFRKNYYKSFFSFNSVVLSEVSFGKKTIKSLIEENNNGNTFYRAFDLLMQKKNIELSKRVYTNDDLILLKEYSLMVGKSDSKTQEAYLTKMSEILSEIYNKCVDEEKKYKELYFKLGLLVGLIFFIIII